MNEIDMAMAIGDKSRIILIIMDIISANRRSKTISKNITWVKIYNKYTSFYYLETIKTFKVKTLS